MEDDYELVSKKLVKQLKEENSKLKDKIANTPKVEEKEVDNTELINQIVDVLHEESQKERELILENLSEIKELNKSTLDNLLTKTQGLDERLESMVDTISGLVDNLTNLIDSLSDFKGGFDIKKLEEKLSKLQTVSVPAQNTDTPKAPIKVKNPDILTKLNEISIFMENLRVLLSYVKPYDLVMDKPKNQDNISSSNNQSSNS